MRDLQTLIALYTLSRFPQMGMMSRRQSGPGWEPRAAIMASPSISCSAGLDTYYMHAC